MIGESSILIIGGVRRTESGVNPPLAPPRRGRKKKKEKVFSALVKRVYDINLNY
ncbi:MAG: hypothetical protein F6K48_05000 [Okeania sp. SIO3H1]|nr:hypothetical protein [Okeania sp. SIO3H1]